jgi:hypothetical protein
MLLTGAGNKVGKQKELRPSGAPLILVKIQIDKEVRCAMCKTRLPFEPSH